MARSAHRHRTTRPRKQPDLLMCLQALDEFGEFLWLDWDTVLLRELDDEFWDWCRGAGTPKFLGIPNYWATVNCGVYFCPGSWRDRLARSCLPGERAQ